MVKKKGDHSLRSAEMVQLQPRKEISFWLDSYDDLFSDFDPRPYAQKGFSEDFLDEAKRA